MTKVNKRQLFREYYNDINNKEHSVVDSRQHKLNKHDAFVE